MSRVVTGVLALAFVAVIGLSIVVADEGKQSKEGKRPDPQQFFQKLDTNSDGKLSLEEWSKGPMAQRVQDEAKRKAVFGKIDANGDGGITLDELKAAHEKMSKGRHGKGDHKRGERKKDEPKKEDPKKGDK